MSKMRSYNRQSIDTIRFLAIDAIQKANSGHPGAPLGAAPMAYVLWRNFLKHNPRNPLWFNRDRFVLSAGHASMLIYALLHLTGYDVSMDDIKQFRQLGSITPGHPERGVTPGVEITTGPLGQGLSNAVGFALAENILAESYNRPGHNIIDHYTYVLASDGDMEEGVAHEAISLAGTLNLHKLICLYDDNGISIDGSTELHLREDVPARFRACGWDTYGPVDGNDVEGIAEAIEKARSSKLPSLISVKTVIGYGSPGKAGKASSHGAPLGEDEVEATRKSYGWQLPPFAVPESVYDDLRSHATKKGEADEIAWKQDVAKFQAAHPQVWETLTNGIERKIPPSVTKALRQIVESNTDKMATRVASSKVLQLLADELPYLIGGSADLAESNHTLIDKSSFYQPENRKGRNIQFGIREHGMGAIANGLSAHGGIIPYTATFLAFLDYMRPSVRLSALSDLQVIWIYTHDSIGVGEDGPTHQPVSHLMSMRLIPELRVFRPADMRETAAAWQNALINTDKPTVLVLSRQSTPPLPDLGVSIDDTKDTINRGAYVVAGKELRQCDVVFIATGTEVAPTIRAHTLLKEKGISSRVVSMPCWEVFEEQDDNYRQEVMLPQVKARISVEAGATLGWQKYVGLTGTSVGIDTFGMSAPGPTLMREFGFTDENIANKALALLKSL